MKSDLDTLSHKLKERRAIMITYLKMRVELSDWHGVMDAAADIREIEAQLSLLEGKLVK